VNNCSALHQGRDANDRIEAPRWVPRVPALTEVPGERPDAA